MVRLKNNLYNSFPTITYPSDLYSIAGDTIELAKPVIGIKEPAPANFPILLNILRPVRKALKPNFETAKQYQDYVDKKSPNSPILKNCLCAFLDLRL